MTAAVEIEAIEKRYGETVSLRSASLSVRPGEFMTLVGPSGCGKSTLLRIIAGLAPQTSGEIAIGGEPVDHLPPKAREHLFTAFQGGTRKGGSGLGLAISRSLAHLHGGAMRIHSVEGKGTIISVRIPDRERLAALHLAAA